MASAYGRAARPCQPEPRSKRSTFIMFRLFTGQR
jgi:hypothetical protein